MMELLIVARNGGDVVNGSMSGDSIVDNSCLHSFLTSSLWMHDGLH